MDEKIISADSLRDKWMAIVDRIGRDPADITTSVQDVLDSIDDEEAL